MVRKKTLAGWVQQGAGRTLADARAPLAEKPQEAHCVTAERYVNAQLRIGTSEAQATTVVDCCFIFFS